MNTKQLIVILIGALIVGMVLAGIWLKISPKERYKQKYSELKDISGTRIFINNINTFLTNQMYKGGDYGSSTI
jgi:glucose uptake protein GlcU